jgi:hypothetical protein
MSEISDLVGIYGAIDQAIADDQDLRARVARLIPVYRDPEVRWFDEFVAWTLELRQEESDAPPFPPLVEALHDLARFPAVGRMRARRLHALTVTLHTFPPDRRSDVADAAVAALAVEGLVPDDDRAQQLVVLLADESLLPPAGEDQILPAALDAWWANLLQTASSQGLIGDPAEFGPRPCSGQVEETQQGPAAKLKTQFETDKIGFEDAVAFLEPKNWPHCSNFWCSMDEVALVAPNVHRYHEVVSTDCPNAKAAWTISAELDFVFTRTDHTASAEYRLSEGHPQAGDDVVVDAGSLSVRRLANPERLLVTTTKRVRFSHAFSGEALGLVMCALGYASVAEDLVFSCALARAGGEGSAFPPKRPLGSGQAETPATPEAENAAPDFGPTIKLLADHAATAIKVCIDDCSEAAQATSKKISAGTYDANALVQDMAGVWVRMLREGATLVDIGIRSAGTVPRKPRGT